MANNPWTRDGTHPGGLPDLDALVQKYPRPTADNPPIVKPEAIRPWNDSTPGKKTLGIYYPAPFKGKWYSDDRIPPTLLQVVDIQEEEGTGPTVYYYRISKSPTSKLTMEGPMSKPLNKIQLVKPMGSAAALQEFAVHAAAPPLKEGEKPRSIPQDPVNLVGRFLDVQKAGRKSRRRKRQSTRRRRARA